MLGESVQSVAVAEDEMANEDDDYMSDTFIACTSDIRPGELLVNFLATTCDFFISDVHCTRIN